MKSRSVKMAFWAGALAVGAGCLHAGYLYDDFEGYLYGTNLAQLAAQGWGASDSAVAVSSNVLGRASQLALLPSDTVATNTAPAGAAGRVWSDWLMNGTSRYDPSMLPTINSNAVVMAGVTVAGYAAVYNTASNGWDVCTKDARGTSVGAGVGAEMWTRLTVCEDFSSQKAAVFLDGRLVRQGIPFITNVAHYAGIRFKCGSGATGYVDNVYVSNAVPSDLAAQAPSSTNDINGDGLVDTVELMQYGALAKVVPFDAATITGALAIVEAGNRVVVSNGAYAGSVVLSNGVTLVGTNMSGTGPNLEVDGILTAGTGTVMVASGGFTVTGQVNVLAGGVLTLSNTAATFGGLATAAGGVVQVTGSGTLTIGGTTKGAGTYYTVTNVVASAGNGTISPSGTSTMVSGWSNVTYTLAATNSGYVVGSLTNNGAVTNFAAVKTAQYTDSAITNNRTITAAFVYNGIRYVPGDYMTLTGALAEAQAGDTIVVGDGTYDESLVVSNSVTLIGTNVTGLAGLTILSNQTVVLSGFSAFEVTNLEIQSGAALQMSNTTLTANGLTLSGTFTLDSGWSGVVTPSALNYTNDFESYSLNLPLALCGGQGWMASDIGSVIQGAIYTQGVKAARMAAFSVLSNVVAGTAAQTNVWTDFWINDSTIRYEGALPPQTNSTRAVMLYVNTNNHVTLWNSGAWDECTHDMAGNAAPAASSGQWVRVSVYEDFSGQMAALFLDGRLVRQQVPFVGAVDRYHGLSFRSGDGQSYVDAVKLWTQVPDGLIGGAGSDSDGDGLADALEIQRSGSLAAWPRGAVFKIR